MRNIASLATVSLLALLASCKQEANAAGATGAEAVTAANKITDVLAGVKDSETAKKASESLGALTTNLGGIMEKLKSAAGAMGGDAAKGAGDLKGMAGDAAKKVASMISPELTGAFTKITEQITRISANADMLAPLKGAFDKIKAMMPTGN